jgi:hypothetical protein
MPIPMDRAPEIKVFISSREGTPRSGADHGLASASGATHVINTGW